MKALSFSLLIKISTAAILLVLAAALVSAPSSPFTPHDRAFYADANTIDFVRPGLQFRITGAEITADGTIKARIRVTDPRGLALDRLGVNTPGTVAMSFIAATIPAGQTQYSAYTTRVQTSPITNVAATQAAGQNNGTFERVADGEYVYTFSVRAPATLDRNATHAIGVYGSRNLSEFDLGTNYDDDVFAFVPAGGAVRTTRDVIKTATCNKCHDQLAFHGGSRRSVELCVMCHTRQTTDPDTGNTVDMPQMVHKIHMGKDLPSVQAGGKYVIIGNAQSVNDYSHIGFPAGANACQVCHESGKGAAQESAWLAPNRAACGACHDDVNFASGKGHVDLPQVSDNQCSNCHIPDGELDRDASIMGAHRAPRFAKALPGTVFDITAVDGARAGQRPTITFTVKDKTGKAIPMPEMTRLQLVTSGPATDYTAYWSEDVRQAEGSGDGRYFWTLNRALPADAKGTWSVGIEGYRQITLLPGTQKQLDVRDAGSNRVFHFSVDGTRVAARRQIVSNEKCNACHNSLSLHGDNRNRVEQCVLCHNPKETDALRRPAADMPAQSVHFATMIHKIHSGKELPYDYSIYGFGSVKHNYNEVGFPAPRQNCQMCHVPGSEQLPVRAVEEVTDPRGLLNPVGPTTAACTGCHATTYAASHALAQTTRLGESCAACHGPNADFSVNRAHAR